MGITSGLSLGSRGPAGAPPRPRQGRRPGLAAAWLTAAVWATAADVAVKADDVPRIASRSTDPVKPTTAPGLATPAADDTVAAAKRAIADCQAKFARVRDYTCTFHKRERIDGRLTTPHVMQMKARALPTSFYLKFQKPNKGREAIYVAGRNGGRVLAHDVGFGKLLAGTMHLDPNGSMAMEDCRHPVTEAGIGALADTVARRWNKELKTGESVVTFHSHMRVGPHPCTMIESVHPDRGSQYLFHKVRLYIDHEHGLPIRFEAYDWPARPGAPAELIEEYTYLGLKVNIGLTDHDFDPNNQAYAFGRF